MNRPPLRDVAQIAGVSEPTVSRVINGKPGVADATRRRVNQALESLGFSQLLDSSTARRGVAGIVAGDFSNPVFPTLVNHLGDELATRGVLSTVVLADDHRNIEERCIGELVAAGVDSLVFIGGRHAQIEADLGHYQRLSASGVPFVFVNGDATALPVAHIRCDEGVAAQAATRHLLDLGHRRIGCIVGGTQYVPTRRMIHGHRRAMEQAGLTVHANAVASTAFTLEAAQASAQRMLADGYTAFISGNDLMALGVILAARRAGKSVPHDVSVVGYDGTDFTAYTDPPLTTMRQPFEDMAQLIARVVVGELDGEEPRAEHFVFEAELVARSSAGPPAQLPPRRGL